MTNPVSILSHLLTITIQENHVVVIAFVYFEYKQILSSKSNQSYRQYQFIFRTETHEIVHSVLDKLAPNHLCLGERGQKPDSIISGTSPYRPY